MVFAIIVVILRIVGIIILILWGLLTLIASDKEDKESITIQKINELVILLGCILGACHLIRYSPIELKHDEILTYAKDESDNRYDPLEWLWSKYDTEPYNDDDMIDAYSEGISDGIDYSIEYYEYLKNNNED